MTPIEFLTAWALRSAILITAGALLLWALRVKDSSLRLAAWTGLLCASLALPILTGALPRMPIATRPPAALQIDAPELNLELRTPLPPVPRTPAVIPRPARFDPAIAALAIYGVVSLALLARLTVGLVFSLRLLRSARPTGRSTHGIEIRESESVTAPVTLGILRPAIVLPADWHEWEAPKLEAVLAHERSHIRRRDPAMQLLSTFHRALLWHSPLSWFLHRRIVRVAEEASDDAALSVTSDRGLYAEVLLEFMQRGVRRASWIGVPMARYGKVEARIHRILDEEVLSRGVTRSGLAAILALGSPLAYIVAAAYPQTPQKPPQPATPVPPIIQSARPTPKMVQQPPRSGLAYLSGLGTVTAFSTVVIKARVDGQLVSLGFEEGAPVQTGQLLASIDPGTLRVQLARAQSDLERDEGRAGAASDRLNVERLKFLLADAEIHSPITGVAGLRMVDAGNFVHAGDPIVVITQVQPIAVLFTVPEDALPQVLARRRQGAEPQIEAWNRDNTIHLASGRLTAVDNLIDEKTGTARIKAVFDNKDGAMFPGQFVNVRMQMAASGK